MRSVVAFAVLLIESFTILACSGNTGSQGPTACADLQDCCSAGVFPANGRAGCDALTQAGDDTACAQALGSYVSAGVCTGSTGSAPGHSSFASGACSLTPGAYRVHFNPSSGGTACPTPTDTTVTVTSNDPVPGAADAGLACTTTNTGCTFTSTCEGDSSGYRETALVSIDESGSTITGSETVTATSDSTGMVLVNCTYSFAYTKE
jgi:hypothetical protein